MAMHIKGHMSAAKSVRQKTKYMVPSLWMKLDHYQSEPACCCPGRYETLTDIE